MKRQIRYDALKLKEEDRISKAIKDMFEPDIIETFELEDKRLLSSMVSSIDLLFYSSAL